MSDASTKEGFGASHTSFYTSAVAKDSYSTLDEILDAKMKDEGVRGVTKEVLQACVKITEALRVNLVTVADAQNSVFGDVQLGVDVIADDLMWDMAKGSKLVREASSEEEPVMVETNKDGRFTICWDPLDGSSIVDNNWAVGTIVGTPPPPACSRWGPGARLHPTPRPPNLRLYQYLYLHLYLYLHRTDAHAESTNPAQASGTRRRACSAPPAATRSPPSLCSTAPAPPRWWRAMTACTSSRAARAASGSLRARRSRSSRWCMTLYVSVSLCMRVCDLLCAIACVWYMQTHAHAHARCA